MYSSVQKKANNEAVIQNKDNEALSCFEDNRDDTLQRQEIQSLADNSPRDVRAYQLKAMADSNADDQDTPIQKQEKPNNTGLPDNLKFGIENLSGYSMDDVKVHYNSSQPAQLGAHAYAQGSDIHVASGQEKHLAHEAWHVVQQKQGRVKPTMQMKGKAKINDDAGLEREADVMGSKAMQNSIQAKVKDVLTTKNISNVSSEVFSLKKKEHNNPTFVANYKTYPKDKYVKELQAIATSLSSAADDARKALQKEVSNVASNKKTIKSAKKALESLGVSKAHVQNFFNKYTDFSRTGVEPHKEAGYIIEGIIDQKAKALGCKLQVSLGSARPDYQYETSGDYKAIDPDNKRAEYYGINALYDATSEIEANKGHILSKIYKMKASDALEHPFLFDIYYRRIDFGKKGAINLKNDKDAKKRQEEIRRRREEEFELREERLGTLRSSKKIKK